MAFLLVAELLVVGISTVSHELDIDESWSSEQAYFKARDGYVHSNFFKGFSYQDEEIVVYHRLFISVAGFLFNLFGFGLGTLRIIPIASGILVLLLLWQFSRRQLQFSVGESLGVLVVFLLIPQAFYFLKIARPEMMVALFGFASFVLLFGHWRSPSWKWIVLAGIAAGAAMLTHLNGAIFIGTGGLVLLWQRRWKEGIVFGVCALAVIAPYLYDVITNYQLFQAQISNSYVASKTDVQWFTPLVNLSREHQRLFRKPEIILPIVLFLGLLVARWKHHGPEFKYIRIYVLILMVVFGLVVEDKTIKYSAYLAPFWAIMIAEGLARVPKRSKAKPFLAVSVIAFVAFGMYFQVKDSLRKAEYVEFNRQIGSHLPDGAWCVAPMNFMYNEIERLNIVCADLARLETNNQPTVDSLAAFCDRKQAPYLIFNTYGNPIDDMKELKSDRARVAAKFTIVAEAEGYTVLKRVISPDSLSVN